MRLLSLPFLAAAFALMIAGCTTDIDLLRERGVETEASITTKREEGSNRKGRGRLTFTLYYFAKDSAALAKDAAQDGILADTSLSMAERLDKWDPVGGGLGKFMSTDIKVPASVFDAHREGDRVPVYYLPEKPEVVMLKEML